MDQLQELQNTLQQIYFKNLNLFKNYYPIIYNKLLNSEKMNVQNYSLEFINNEFQLIKLDENKNLYEIDPFKDSIHRLNTFELTSAFNIIRLEEYPKKVHYKNEINSYIYINEFIKNFSKINLEINKFIFIGTLLGVHINDFHRKFNATTYLIFEESLEIFKLSMFLTDYTELHENSKLFFSIEENFFEMKKTIKNFLEYKYEFNNLIHYELANKNCNLLLKTFSQIFTQFGGMRYPFSEYLISLKRGYNYFFNTDHSIIDLSKDYNILSDKKVIFLGAGVSLAKNLEWLYLNQNKFIIVATSAVLKHLEILEIVPDIIIVIDGQKDSILVQFEVNHFMYENSIILSTIKLDEDVYDLLKNTNIFFMQNSLELFENIGFFTGVTVGDIGVNILSKLGVKELYLLGIDAALDSKNGKTHVGTHKSSRKIPLNNTKNDSLDFQKTVVKVKGNLQKEVPTLLEYKEMIECLSETLLNLKNKIKVYNLSDGAFFENSIPLNIKSTIINDEIDKEFSKKFILNELSTISKKNLDSLDINNLKKEQKILKKLNSLNINNKFINNFNDLKDKFPNSLIINILGKYFKLILPYYNFLEDKELANTLLNNQITEILNKFNTIYNKIVLNKK